MSGSMPKICDLRPAVVECASCHTACTSSVGLYPTVTEATSVHYNGWISLCQLDKQWKLKTKNNDAIYNIREIHGCMS